MPSRSPARGTRTARDGPSREGPSPCCWRRSPTASVLLGSVDRGLGLALGLVERLARALATFENTVDRVHPGLPELRARRRERNRERVPGGADEERHGVVEVLVAHRLVDVLEDLHVGARLGRVEPGERATLPLAQV